MSELAPKKDIPAVEAEITPEYSDVTPEMMEQAALTDKKIARLALRGVVDGIKEDPQAARTRDGSASLYRRAENDARQTVAEMDDPDLNLDSADRVSTMLDDAHTENSLHDVVSSNGAAETMWTGPHIDAAVARTAHDWGKTPEEAIEASRAKNVAWAKSRLEERNESKVA